MSLTGRRIIGPNPVVPKWRHRGDFFSLDQVRIFPVTLNELAVLDHGFQVSIMPAIIDLSCQ